ncbi:MAG: hypothetical protein AAGK97_10900, partial [Bacteroidota bacterium]
QIWIGIDQVEQAAALQINSNNKGLLIPRMTNLSKLGIQNPPEGLIVFDSTLSEISIWENGVWNAMNYWKQTLGGISYLGGTAEAINLKATALQGARASNAYVDANGNLKRNNRTKIFSIKPFDFRVSSNTLPYELNRSTFNVVGGPWDESTVYASLHLPHKAIIDSVKIHYIDNSDNLKLFVQFAKIPLKDADFEIVPLFESVGTSSEIRCATISNLNLEVDHETHSNFMEIYTEDFVNDILAWQGIKIGAIVIYYHETF